LLNVESSVPYAVVDSCRELTDDELNIIAGGGVVGATVVAGLQGAVSGGIAAAAGAAGTGQPIGAAGISGMFAGSAAGMINHLMGVHNG